MQIGRRPSQSPLLATDTPVLDFANKMVTIGTKARVILLADSVLAGIGGAASIIWADEIISSVISPRVFVGPLGSFLCAPLRG